MSLKCESDNQVIIANANRTLPSALRLAIPEYVCLRRGCEVPRYIPPGACNPKSCCPALETDDQALPDICDFVTNPVSCPPQRQRLLQQCSNWAGRCIFCCITMATGDMHTPWAISRTHQLTRSPPRNSLTMSALKPIQGRAAVLSFISTQAECPHLAVHCL